jgi:hypothetical protein
MNMQDNQAGQQPEDAAGLRGDQDPILELFLKQPMIRLEPGMTLMVGGLLVSGTLVGFRRYLEGIANEFRNATSATPGVGAMLAEGLRRSGAGGRLGVLPRAGPPALRP